jgi:Phosphotransferase enzyme family
MTAPDSLSIPHGSTAVRPDWSDLPDDLRTRIEERLGGQVTAVASQGSGFTPGFASRLLYAEGRCAFVKAASSEVNPVIADSYRAEGRIVPMLPAHVPAPTLRWTLDEAGWVVLCFDDVPGRPPARPWRPDELTSVLTALEPMAEALSPGPAGLVVPYLREWIGEEFGYWRRLVDGDSASGDTSSATPSAAGNAGPSTTGPLAELARLDDLAAAALDGDAVVHCDLRDDNVIIGDDAKVWVCDWNWPSRGAPWVDLLTILISARSDGYDADALFAAHPLGSDVDGEAVDAALAGLGGFFTRASLEPEVAGSPYLRSHQALYAQATLSWLAVRRGWVT